MQRELRSACRLETLEARVLMSASPVAAVGHAHDHAVPILAAPSRLSVAAKSTTSIRLCWTDNASTATGYDILRSTNGRHYTQLNALRGAHVTSYTDTRCVSGQEYYYEIEAVRGSTTSAASPAAHTITPMMTPSGLRVSIVSPTSIQLNWTDNDASATGYDILRSTNGVNFTQVGKVSGGTAVGYTDTTAPTGHVDQYEVEAYDALTNSPVSNVASATTPLIAPTGLTASPAGSSVNLHWTDNDTSATSYDILRSTPGTGFTLLTLVNNPAAASYTDTTAPSGSVVQYQVEACDAVTNSPVSNVASATTPLIAPTGLTATLAGSLVNLNWTDNDTSATRYDILRSTSGTGFILLTVVNSPTAASYTDTNSVSGQEYYYEVVAVDGQLTSMASNGASVITPIAAPSGLTAMVLSPTSIQLFWTDNDASTTGYRILRSTDGGTFTQIGQVTNAGVVNYTDTAVPTGSDNQYEVEAYDALTNSPVSNVASAATLLFAPTGLTASIAGSSVNLNWTDNDTNATRYDILRSTDSMNFTLLTVVSNPTAASYTDISSASGQEYYYEVIAVDGQQTSAASNIATVVTPMAAPSGLSAWALSPTSIQLNWTDNDASATGYDILRSTNGVNFTQVGLTTAGAVNYIDTTAPSGSVVQYQVEAYDAVTNSPLSNVASATTPLIAPTGLTASLAGSSVNLNWTDNDPSATSYDILRSTDGMNFTLLTVVNSPTAASYTDTSADSAPEYYYEVVAVDGQLTSAPSNIAAVITSLAAPSGLSASVLGPTSIQLNWTDNDTSATSYDILRSTSGSGFALLTVLNSPTAASYTDTSAVSGQEYYYEVVAVDGQLTSPASNIATAITPLAAPSGLTALVLAPTSIQLSWTDNDASATGYDILRSTNGGNFTQVGKVSSGTAVGYTDTTAPSGSLDRYEVKAYDAVTNSPVSNVASATTPLIAPTGLTASFAGPSVVNLNWTDNDTSATGYYILRSTNDVNFTSIANLAGGSIDSYSDTTIVPSTTYYYEVEAYNSLATSAPSAAVSPTAPPGNDVTIVLRYGDELTITAPGPNDSVAITESDSTLTIDANAQIYTDAVPAAGVFLYTRGGNDTINIASSVTAQLTIETIDGVTDRITNADANAIAWIDSMDIYSGPGSVHRVSSFMGGTSTAQGAALANPSDAGATMTVNASLFSTGPAVNDINQGDDGDCYLMASLAAFAQQNPSVLLNSAVDMGDGTYVVQFYNGKTPVFVRISNAFSTSGSGGWFYAQPGADGSIWGPVIEKAFCEFAGNNSYASISGGWMGTVYNDLGVGETDFYPSNYSSSSFYNTLSSDLANGQEVTLATYDDPPGLVGDHAYTLISVYTDANDNQWYVVRNPWGVSGDPLENSQGYATLSFAQMVDNFTEGAASTS